MRYRYIATFEAEPNECFTQEVQEKLKNRIKEDIELQCGNNVFVTLEDEYCIKRNDTIGESIVATLETTTIPESSYQNEYIAYAKLLINNLKQVQKVEGSLKSDFDEAMIAAINVLIEKGNKYLGKEKEEKEKEKEEKEKNVI